jgi:Fe2+ or Zn2+ uptake regulation protein
VDERRRSDYAGRSVAEFAARSREKGLAVTSHRVAIIQVLLASAEHPTAEAIYAAVRRAHPHMQIPNGGIE